MSNLLPGEQLAITVDDRSVPIAVSESAINEKYVKGDVRIVTEQARYPLNTIADMVHSSNYLLRPEYQRRHRWDLCKKSRLIESLIINVPIPPVFLYEYEYSKYEVMDGLQRLTAISEFYNDRFSLEGLEQWPELVGRTYSTLPEKVREGIDRRYLSSVILLKETAKTSEEASRLKELVFERLNSGGARLVPQESRNAILNGPLNDLCVQLSLNGSLCRLWGIPEPSDGELQGRDEPTQERLDNEAFQQMEDVELVLRFFAYRQKHVLHRGTDLRTYLDAYLRRGNGFERPLLANMEALFLQTIETVERVFGERAFWLYRERRTGWGWFARPTTTIYDPLMRAVSDRLNQAERLVSRADSLRAELEKFYQTNYATFAGRNVNRSALVERDAKFAAFLDDVLK